MRSLCNKNWSSGRVVNLISMFRDSNLNADEMSIVVEKLADVIKKMKPDEVPPIVYQVRLFDFFLNIAEVKLQDAIIASCHITNDTFITKNRIGT